MDDAHRVTSRQAYAREAAFRRAHPDIEVLAIVPEEHVALGALHHRTPTPLGLVELPVDHYRTGARDRNRLRGARRSFLLHDDDGGQSDERQDDHWSSPCVGTREASPTMQRELNTVVPGTSEECTDSVKSTWRL